MFYKTSENSENAHNICTKRYTQKLFEDVTFSNRSITIAPGASRYFLSIVLFTFP